MASHAEFIEMGSVVESQLTHHRYILKSIMIITNFSVVVRGQVENAADDVALKFIKRTERNHSLIENEVNVLGLLHHECIVPLLDHFDYDCYHCLAFPYVPYGTVAGLREAGRDVGINEAAIRFITYQLLLVLRYMHSQSIWHRDLKPENILVSSNQLTDPKIIVADFGFSKIAAPGYMETEEYLGTPDYCSPEILFRRPYDQRCDVWALGILVYKMFSGSVPFPNDNEITFRRAVTRGNPIFPVEKFSGVSEKAIDFIRSTLVLQDQRPSVEKLLEHPWIGVHTTPLDEMMRAREQLVFEQTLIDHYVSLP